MEKCMLTNLSGCSKDTLYMRSRFAETVQKKGKLKNAYVFIYCPYSQNLKTESRVSGLNMLLQKHVAL